jgi:hypothetical protein
VVAVNSPLAPVVPGSAALPSFAGLSSYRNDRPLTRLYQPPPRREPQWLCSVRLVDAKGRVIDRALLPALGWNPGLELGWTLESHAVAVGRFGNPELWITAAGELRLPARFRRKVAIQPGDRILLAANPAEDRLLMFSPTAVDTMVMHKCQTTAPAAVIR